MYASSLISYDESCEGKLGGDASPRSCSARQFTLLQVHRKVICIQSRIASDSTITCCQYWRVEGRHHEIKGVVAMSRSPSMLHKKVHGTSVLKGFARRCGIRDVKPGTVVNVKVPSKNETRAVLTGQRKDFVEMMDKRIAVALTALSQ